MRVKAKGRYTPESKQKAEGRRQKAEGRRQKAEGREEATVDSWQFEEERQERLRT